MKKTFLIGDNEKLMTELSQMLDGICDITDELDESVELVFDVTNSSIDMKLNILNFIEEKNISAVIISSSVCISLAEQSVGMKNPSRLTGAAMFCSFTSLKGVELCRTSLTSEESFNAAKSVFEEAGKKVFEVTSRTGMISLRIISMIINEAFLVLQEGTSDQNDIDTAMKLGTNYPHGPIEWCDIIGVDLIYSVLKSMHEEYGDDRYRITPLLREKYLGSIAQR